MPDTADVAGCRAVTSRDTAAPHAGEAWPRGRARHGGVDELPLPAGPGEVGGGRLWLSGKHYVGPDVEAALASVGAAAVVCLCEEYEIADRYPGYVNWLRRHRHGRALWWPVPDLHAPALAPARDLLSALDSRLAGGEVILMHCGAGMGRAGTMAAGLLITRGARVEEAVAAVAKARPGAGPEVGSQTDLLRAL